MFEHTDSARLFVHLSVYQCLVLHLEHKKQANKIESFCHIRCLKYKQSPSYDMEFFFHFICSYSYMLQKYMKNCHDKSLKQAVNINHII